MDSKLSQLLVVVCLLHIGVCVVKAADFPFSFFVQTPYATLAYPNKTMSGLSEAECVEACLYEVDFNCRSAEYHQESAACLLSMASATSLATSLTTDKHYNYYEKLVGECSFPAVGLEDGTVSLDDVTMSSFLGDMEDGPIGISKGNIRLNSDGAWCSKELDDINSITDWVQVEFNEFKIIGAVATQGFHHSDLDPIFVSQYYLKYTNATNEPWIEYEEGGQTKIFEANEDKDTIVKNDLANPFVAKFVRLYPVACENHPCLRLEFYACRVDCEPNPCQNNGTCVDDIPGVWNVTCTCLNGYVDDFCQTNFDECSSNPCQNGASCVDHVDYFTCVCASGWADTLCDRDIDECLSDPCQNDATCTDLVDGYNCTCPSGFEGTHCENFTVVCPDGFVKGLFSCYSVVSAANNYTDYNGASSACQGIRAHLAYPEDYFEHTVISDALDQLHLGSSDVLFIGLKYNGSILTFDDDSGSPSLATWDENGTSVAYWASGYPTGTHECLAMVKVGNDWAWRNINCQSSNAYICEQNIIHGNMSEWSRWSQCSVTCGPGQGTQIRYRSCTDPAPLLDGDECVGVTNQTQACGEICPIVECPDGFVTRYDTCYLLQVNESVTYEEAQLACQNLSIYGGHLILLNDLSEETFVTQMLFDNYADTAQTYFTGNLLTSGNVTLDWVFAQSAGDLNLTSWEMVGETPWGTDGPPAGVGSSGCVVLALNGTTWRWEVEDCAGTLGYICEVNLAGGSWSPWAGWGECNSSCGAGNQTRERWCDTPAPILGGPNCTGPNLDTRPCSTICPIVTCPLGYSVHNDSCYIVIDSAGRYSSRDQAQSYCESIEYRAHLSYIQSEAELDFVSFRLEDSNIGHVEMAWIGLMYTEGALTYWNGSETVNTSSWSGAEPWAAGYGESTGEACVGMAYDVAEWKWRMANTSCDVAAGFVCEVTQAPGNWGSWGAWAECSVTCGNGTQTRHRPCDNPAPVLNGDYCPGTNSSMRNCSILCPIVTCPPGFDPYYDSCYSTVYDPQDFTSFDAANSSCLDLTNGDGRLAHINDYPEQEFLSWVLKNLLTNTSGAVYAGMTYSAPNANFYSDSGSPDETTYPDGSIWAEGYPVLGGGDCVGLVYSNPTWEWLLGNVDCNDDRAYICEITQGDGSWGSWGAWSQCTESCGEGTQTRLRSCDDPPPILGGNDCVGSNNDTIVCNYTCPIVTCPEGYSAGYDSCYFAETNSSLFVDYEGANSTCALMTNYTGHLLHISDETELNRVSWTMKGLGTYTMDAFYTGMKYASSSVDFDDGSGSPTWGSYDPWKNNYPTSSPGDECVMLMYNHATWEWKLGNKDCSGSYGFVCEITQTHGNWGGWSAWNECSRTCDVAPNMGTQTRNRTCSNPAPILGGDYCEGNETAAQACGSQCPPVHGNYTAWSYDDCSVTCYTYYESDLTRYGGLQNRTRNCTNPAPRYGGDQCAGNSTEIVSCGTQDGNICPPVNGSWTAWSNFSECSTTCGGGTRNRTRYCTDPRAQNGGESCPGNGTDSKACNTQPCPVDGNFTSWSAWSECTETCVGGEQYRERNCTDPEPAYGGLNCSGASIQWQNCSEDTQCSVHGAWSEWSAWSNCTVECEGIGSQNRTRTCTNPAPAYGGNDCPVNEPNNETRVCGTQNCPIDGGFSDWLGWSGCTAHCGTGGVRYRHHPCTNPPPQYGGNECEGDAYIREACDSSVPCRDTFSTVACDKRVHQSSVVGNMSAEFAVDGNTNGSVPSKYCSQTGSETDPWWQVDLGGVYQVKEVRVHTRSDACDSAVCDWGILPFIVRVGISEDVNGNVRCGELQTAGNRSLFVVNCGTPLFGQYVAVHRIQADAALTLCEVEVTVVSSTYRVNGSAGHGSLTFDQAKETCNKQGAELSAYEDLYAAWSGEGLDGCNLAWLADGSVRCPIQSDNGSCSLSQSVGVYHGGTPGTNETYDAYCTSRGQEGNPLGLISGLIADSQITASSVNQTGSCGPEFARLYHSDSAAAWVPAKHRRKEWLQIELGEPVTLKAIATSGMPCCDSWVTGYYIRHSLDGVDWMYYEQDGGVKFMVANYDSTSVVRNTLPEPIKNVRFVRIEPRSWNGSISLRLELFGDYEPVDGEWSSWGSWGECSVPCEGVGTWQRNRSCSHPSQSRKGRRCREDPYRDRIVNPLVFFKKTSLSELTDYDIETVMGVQTAKSCALICLWDRPDCRSFNYDPLTSECVLSNTSATVENVGLSTTNVTSDYYELEYSSCNVHNIIKRGRGVPPQSGVYDITVEGSALSVYCDMDRDGGGWTLLVTSATTYGWDNDTVLLRNSSNPSIENDYSILKHADAIKNGGTGATFKYRLESIERGKWGGIFEAPRNHSFISSAYPQRASLVQMFNSWRSGNASLDHIMPWLTTNYPVLLSVQNNTLNNATAYWYGALVCACGNRTWMPYMKEIDASELDSCPEVTTAASLETTTGVGETTTGVNTTEGVKPTTTISSKRQTTEEFYTDATDIITELFTELLTDLSTDIAGRDPSSTATVPTTTAATTAAAMTVAATTPTAAATTAGPTTAALTTSAPAFMEDCNNFPKTIWYWLREEQQEYEPSLEWDLSGRCSYDTAGLRDCSSPCSDRSIPPTIGYYNGTSLSLVSLSDSRSTSQHECTVSLSDNYINFGSFRETCLADPSLCVTGFTMALWVRVNHADNLGERYLMTTGGAGVTDRGISISTSKRTSISSLELSVKVTGDDIYTVATSAVPDQHWFHLTIVYRPSGQLLLHINGNLSDETSSTSGSFTALELDPDGLFILGAAVTDLTNSSLRLNADVSELKVFFRDFSVRDVELFYLGIDPGFEGDLCGDWFCPIHGNLSSWTESGSCSVSCGNDGTILRYRNCTNPAPQYGGDECQGVTEEWVGCNPGFTCQSDEESALGVAQGNITDSYLGQSSCLDNSTTCATSARIGDTDNTHCWTPASNDTSEWLMVELADSVTLRAVGTTGRPADASYVTKYLVSYSSDGNTWNYYEELGQIKVFCGNYDNQNLVRQPVSIATDVSHVRFHPEAWHQQICMRVELYGSYNPIDGQWSSWNSWGPCDVTCGGGTQYRNRTCEGTKHGGLTCPDTDSDSQICSDNPCPIDGNWSGWTTVIGCSVSCGGDGIYYRTRTCTDPEPQYGGANCTGVDGDWEACASQGPCSGEEETALGIASGSIPDSQLSESNCSFNNDHCATWGRLDDSDSTYCWMPVASAVDPWLQIDLVDSVTLTAVAIQGRPSDTNYVTAYSLMLSDDGNSWSDYTERGSTKLFQGNIDNVDTVRHELSGVDSTTLVRFLPETWNGSICMRVELYGKFNPIDGGFSQWSAWDVCTVTCGGGTHTRSRTCDSPSAKYSGADCSGDLSEIESCNENPCPIDGGFGGWIDVTNCSIDCGLYGTLMQERYCDSPEPQYGGANCTGISEQWVGCTVPEQCSASDNYALGMIDSTITDAMITVSEADGNYDGTRARLDTSNADHAWVPTNPDTNDYLQIELPDTITLQRVAVEGREPGNEADQWVTTYTLSTSMNGTDWVDYKEAGVMKVFQGSYDAGTAVASSLADPVSEANYVRFHPVTWYNAIAMRVELYGKYNPIDANWSQWTSWTSCSVTCAGSTETRSRTCDDPAVKYRGNDCPVLDASSQIRECNTQPCPIDGDWTTWTSWASISCTVSCGTQGLKHRTRTCTDPTPQYNGSECASPDYTEEFQTCDSNSACGANYEALGMTDGRISDSQITASSVRSVTDNQAWHGRLSSGTTSGQLCWEPTNSTEPQWLQIDLTTPALITMVGVQGMESADQWVTYYNVSYSTDGITWDTYQDVNGETKIFYGNIDKTGIVKTELASPVSDVVSVRFHPHEWNDYPCLRTEIYGMYAPTACVSSISLSGLVSEEAGNPNYLEINLGSLQTVTMISTQGRSGKWLIGYVVYFSQNFVDWALYVEGGSARNFIGNSDDSDYVTNPLLNAIDAVYLRLVPTSVNSGLSVNVEVYGCVSPNTADEAPSTTVCFEPYGIPNYIFNMDRITTSSIVNFTASANLTAPSNMTKYHPRYAHLHNPDVNPVEGLNGWVSEPGSLLSSLDQWLMIDFESRVTITGLALQGVELPEGHVGMAEFSLHYSEDNVIWNAMRKMNSNETMILTGPTDSVDVTLVELTADGDTDLRPLTLRYLRIQSEVNTTDSVGLRLETYGCSAAVDSVCKDGWSVFENSCYKFYQADKQNWDGAQSTCVNEGGHLATINSVREQEFLENFPRVYPEEDFLIGLNRRADFKEFVWSNGTFYAYAAWAKGQPTDGRFDECTALSKEMDGRWVSVDCSDMKNYVCEYERESTTYVVCGENDWLMACPDDHKVNVTSAQWGRTSDWFTCPQETSLTASALPCSSNSIEGDIDTECHNVTRCSGLADESVYGYPCSDADMHLYLNTTYECVKDDINYARACQDDFLYLTCPPDDRVLHIVTAMYGRTMDNSVCPGPDRDVVTNCTSSNSLQTVRTYCEGHHSCKIAVEVASFNDDPCVGVVKYLDVNYTCVSNEIIIPDVYEYQGDCEEGWLKHDYRCIRAFPNASLKFEAADDECNKEHGHLAGVPGSNTQSFLEGLLTDYSSGINYWIGCVQTDNNTCRWRDGIGHEFTDFNSQYVSVGGERCIELRGDENYKWEDARCDTENAFICQQDCMLTFGMMDKTIGNHQLTVSSTKLVATLDSFKWDARLHAPYGAWVAGEKDTSQFYQIDFERVMRVKKIATQGHPKYQYWIEEYRLDYSVNATANGSMWLTYQEDGVDKIFQANNNNTSVAYQYFDHFMFARYLRLVPLNWTGEIALRMEVYGCYLQDDKPEVLEVVNATKLHYEYNGTIQCHAFGIPVPTMRWERDGFHYTGGINATIVTYQEDDYHMISEVRFHPLSDDRGFYTCVAENMYGSNRKSFYNHKGLPTYLGGNIRCDDEILEYVCPEGQYIRITSAFYGRLQNEKCIIYDDYYPTDCEYDPDTVMHRLERQCNNKRHCMVHVSETMFAESGVSYSKCDGFPLYINATRECIGMEWTPWFNYDSGGDKDLETKSWTLSTFAEMCPGPVAIDCRLAGNQQPYYTSGQILESSCSLVRGLVCRDYDQSGGGDCEDYETRYWCPQEYLGMGEVEKAIECDSEELHILCLNNRYIEVHEAFYGRREEGLCSMGNNYSYPLDCSWDAASVLDLVKRNCDNKEECRLNIQLASVLGDPCSDVPKYLDIKYTCEIMRSNMALFHPTNHSSVSSQPSSTANDGNAKSACNSGFCFESEEETAPWWLVDLGLQRNINYVKIISCSNYLDDFIGAQIRIGDSANFWENPVCGSNFTSADGTTLSMYCNQIMAGQYVSVEVPDRTTTLRLCEVSLMYIGKREQTAVACDGQKLQLSCAVSASFSIKILDVFYGRAQDGTVCPHMFANHTYSSGCAASRSTVLDIVRGRCHLQKFCELDVQGDVLDPLVAGAGDPCQNEFKYLEVTYQCSRHVQGELDTDIVGLASQDEVFQFGCIGFKGVIDVSSAYIKPSTTTTPPWAPQDSSIDVSSCSDQDVSSPVQTQCNNKKSCMVRNKDFYLGYSLCATMHQYLEVTFSCKADVPSGDITLIGCTDTDYELSLTCPDGKYIKIQDAFYGRTQVGSSSLICPHSTGQDDTTTCRSTDTLDIVKAYCEDQRSCGLPTAESYLTASDPCDSIKTKYLEVTYNCQEGRPLNDITLYSCEDHADLFLECPDEASHIRILSAELGRFEDGLRCNYRENLPGTVMYTECQTPDVLVAVRDICTNEQNCTVPNYWANYTNEEPCIGTYKYLQVTYRCLLDAAAYDPKEASMFFINPRPTLKSYRLNSHVITSSQERNILSCMNACLALHDCVSFNFKTKRGNSGHLCQLSDAIVEEAESDFAYVNNFVYFQRDSYRQR